MMQRLRSIVLHGGRRDRKCRSLLLSYLRGSVLQPFATSWRRSSGPRRRLSCLRYRFRISHGFGDTAAWLTWAWQNIKALHHTEIFMRDRVTMRNKATDGNWTKMNSKSNRSIFRVIDVRRECVGRCHDTGHIDSIVPLRN